jgi:hypothetical protein
MSYLETLPELIESLADSLGIDHHTLTLLPDDKGHAEDCGCRMCWCRRLEQRIRQAFANEAVLQTAEQQTGMTIVAEMQRMADIGRGLTHQADASEPQPLSGDEYIEAYRKLASAAIDGARDVFRTRP